MEHPQRRIDNPQPQAEHVPFDVNTLRDFIAEAKERWKNNGSLTIAKDSTAVVDGFRATDRLILEAAPGSGKTTVAPVEFLSSMLEEDPEAVGIVVEPRILAVESLSDYVGKEIGELSVDHQHGKHPIEKPNSRLRFTVDKSLRNKIIKEPTLPGISFLVLDEIHIVDQITLALVKEVQAERKKLGMKQLKLVLTSGTLDSQSLEEYLTDGTAEVKTLKVEGHKHVIHENFLENKISADQAPEAAAAQAKAILDNPEMKGDLLIFMPGRREINKTREALTSILKGTDVEIIPLTGGDQDGNPYARIQNNPTNIRRVYVSTDVAETAITIPNVIVIDSGLMKKMVYDPRTRLSTLVTLPHTKVNYVQRKGRSGRTEDGYYFALYTEQELATRAEHEVPEFIQSDITPDILWLKAAGKDIYTYDFKDKPQREVLDQAVESLQKLGALDKDGNITPIGKEMADMDEEPQYARMLIEAKKRNCINEVALVIGALKTNNSIFDLSRGETVVSKYSELVDPSSDVITFLKGWNASVKSKGEGFNKEAIESIKKERNKLKRGSSSPDVVGISLETPQLLYAINLSIAAGIIDKKIVKDSSGAFKYDGAIYSGIKIDKISGFYNKPNSEILSAKVKSNKKPGGNVEAYSEWNMKFDKDQLLGQFDYLNNFFEPNPEEKIDETEIADKPGEDGAVQEVQSKLKQEMANVQDKVVNAPSQSVKLEAETFIDKIRENWHKLTDKVKELYLKFKNGVKKVFGI